MYYTPSVRPAGHYGMAAPVSFGFVTPSRDVLGVGGYVYRQYQDGTIYIVSGPSGAGTTLTPGYGESWNAITSEIGTYPGSEVPQSANSVLEVLSALLTKQDAEEVAGDVKAATQTQQTSSSKVVDAVSQYGPSILSAVSELWTNKRSSIESLYTRLAKKQGKYATATGAKRIALAYEIRALETQITQQQAAGASALQQVQVPTSSASMNYTPLWVAGAAVGMGLLVTALAMARR